MKHSVLFSSVFILFSLVAPKLSLAQTSNCPSSIRIEILRGTLVRHSEIIDHLNSISEGGEGIYERLKAQIERDQTFLASRGQTQIRLETFKKTEVAQSSQGPICQYQNSVGQKIVLKSGKAQVMEPKTQLNLLIPQIGTSPVQGSVYRCYEDASTFPDVCIELARAQVRLN